MASKFYYSYVKIFIFGIFSALDRPSFIPHKISYEVFKFSIIVMGLLVFFSLVCVSFDLSLSVNVIVLSHTISISFNSLNSLCSPIIHCYRNTFRELCEELLKMKQVFYEE